MWIWDFCSFDTATRRHGWRIAFSVDTGGGGQDGPDLGQTRLGRLVSAVGRQLLGKLNSTIKNFPMNTAPWFLHGKRIAYHSQENR